MSFNASPEAAPAAPRRAVGGLFVRRECWRLSRRGALGLLIFLAGTALILQRFLYPFLAVTDRQPSSDYLVVEGWLHADELREGYAEFQAGHYRKILTSGTRVDDEWDPKLKVTYADWGAAKLKRIGMPAELIQAVPCEVEKKDRTYSSAVAVRKWLESQGVQVKQLNVVTEGAHARRSRLLFQMAFGPDVKIGIIAVEDKSYDPTHWWLTSEGVREVVGEAIAYAYARLLFHPAN